MPLLLKVISSKNQQLQQEMEYEFNEQGGTIGRKLSNTWVLPDENRHLSGNHAKIVFENGFFYIVDTSTNGVFVNGRSKPLGKGNRHKLEEGFQLVMGTFLMQVSIRSEASVINENLSQRSDDLFSDLLDDTPDISDRNKPEPVIRTNSDPQQEHSSTPIDTGLDDPFFEFDEFTTDNDSYDSSKENIAVANSSELDAFFEPAKVKKSPEIYDAESLTKDSNKKKHLDNENDQGSDVDTIPDDWNASGSNSFDDLLEGIDDPFATSKEESVKEEIEAPKKEYKKKKRKVATETQKASISDDRFISAFIKGIGLEGKNLESKLSEHHLLIAGRLFRCAIEGTMKVLQSRAEIKNEMRMDMTTIRSIQNNPIKFALDADEAISKLLLQSNKSYMNPEMAMEEAYDDITSHQLAIISGIQASLTYVLKRFEPENLIERLEKDSPISANIPIHRKAKLWETFEKLYDTIETEAEDDFNRLFGQEFAKAYDEQVAKLKKKGWSE